MSADNDADGSSSAAPVPTAASDRRKAYGAIAVCLLSVACSAAAALLQDWSKWCVPDDPSTCTETGLWEECSDNLTKQYLCESTSGAQYGAVRAFMVLSVPAAVASMLIARKVAKDPAEIGYFRVIWYATSAAETLFGLVAMTLYLSVTISAGESHVHYGLGFVCCIAAWIVSIGNVLLCASIGPGGIRGVCDRRVRRGPSLLTQDERDEAASYSDDDDSYPGSPHSFRVDASMVRGAQPAPTVADVSGRPVDSAVGPASHTHAALHPL